MKMNRIIASAVSAALIAAACVPFSANAATDPDGNGAVEIADAVYILSYLAGVFEPNDLSALDFDGNGIISEMDAYTVQLALVGAWR